MPGIALPLANYDPKKVIVIFQGVPLSGFGKDIFVSAEKDEDAFMLSMGVDGNAALSINRNEAGSIKVTLFHTSPSNDVLMASYQLHRLNGVVLGPSLIKDTSGRMLVACRNSWVKKIPSVQRGKEVQEIEWEIATDHLEMIALGN